MARVLHLSDLHVVTSGKLASGVLDTQTLLRVAIDQVLARMDAVGPFDAVLITGDVSDDGSDESYAVARTELDRFGLPLMVVPGNHDRREGLRAAFGDALGMPGEGLIDWVATIAGDVIIGLDTLVEGQGGGRLRPESLALVSSAIHRADGQGLTVALHHPPLKTGIRFMDAIGLENPGELATVLSKCKSPVRIVAGHVHSVHHGRLGAHPVLTAPSVCSAFALDYRADAPVGFMTGPKGCAVFDTAPGGVWAAVPLESVEGPYAF